MAKEEQNTNAQKPKRLARAKIKRPETPEEVQKRKSDRNKTIRNIAVSVFAVLLVLSMMVPSLAAIVTNARQAKAVSQGQEVTSETIDAVYQASAEEAEAALAENPEDKELILDAANSYFGWGYAVGAYATDESAAAHSQELLGKAQGLYDQYLTQEDSSDVAVNRALCLLYSGDTTSAQEALEAIVEKDPDSASAWANLGMIYEMTNPDEAAAAYERAVAADPDDEAGAKSFAQGRLDSLSQLEEAVPEGAVAEEGSEAETEASGTGN